ncbi:MAG: ABC transporter permease [Tatlockia sp.]|jgi:peptide/nickel transport system permease protein
MDLLWTDIGLLFVLFFGVLSTSISLRKKHIRKAFLRILHRPLAVSAGIILLFFLVIGLLDSIHFKENSTQISSIQNTSILDKLLSPLGNSFEKTYSAPFALQLYAIETGLVNGKVQQIYPRLQYPPSFITNHTIKGSVIVKCLIKAFFLSAMLVLLLSGILIIVRGKTLFSKNRVCALTTLFVCFFLVFASYWLSRNFHIFGTGKIGQDIFYYTVKSIRTGLVIGLLTTLFMMPLALLSGITAGYFGGVIDDVIQYIYITLSSIPGVLLITASVLSMQTWIANHPEQFNTLSKSADARLLALCAILGITSWTSLCRLLRAEVLKLREVDFVVAGKALGSSFFTILRKHLLPNVMHIVIITLVLDFSFLVLAEAVLSYVGVGVSPMTISWGNMINSARLELARDPIVWWPILAAFLFMFVLVLASNLFADAVRDAFDPHHS